jgi:hypothetical protein
MKKHLFVLEYIIYHYFVTKSYLFDYQQNAFSTKKSIKTLITKEMPTVFLIFLLKKQKNHEVLIL